MTATIAMARALDLSVTAEGIETEEQARNLRELGCDRGQGYLFARPMPPEDLHAMLVGEAGPSRTRPVSRARR